jgi:NitT/TauT family transport system permease protein
MLQSQKTARQSELTSARHRQLEASSKPEALRVEKSCADNRRFSTSALLVVPAAAAIALAIHLLVSKNEVPGESRTYTIVLSAFVAVALALALTQRWWPSLRARMRRLRPLFTLGVLLLCLWEVVTAGLHLLPLPYFPGPAAVLQNIVNDRALLFDSTWHSLLLLLSGYALGVVSGFTTGVCIGWSEPARYWGMPLLKMVGPIPATAWIPLAMVVSPSALFSAAALIALAVWFPVTMLTASGVSNTRASYLDVARTLGAGERYLIFRVAIPAALPSIFVGLFMGLGASFLTLVVAESVGVKSGLGWYVSWAQGWAEYGKVYAALVIMAVFFSTIMSLLFKLRDRVLVWQKGMIRW